MKQHRKKSQFLKVISMINNVALACKQLGISRNTVYRWRKEDYAFAEAMDEAMQMGIDHRCDVAEGMLAKKVQEGHFPSIKLTLESHRKAYMKPKVPVMPESMMPRRIERVVFLTHDAPEPTEERIQKAIADADAKKQNENPDVLE